jgi:predicted acetyltransferase
MMRRQLDDSREQGYPIAALWASESPIYQRFGYGMATRHMAFRVPRVHTAWLADQPADGQVRLVTSEAAPNELLPIYDRVRAETPGMLERPVAWWRYRFDHLDAEPHRGGFGPMFYALHEGPDGPDAYAAYRVKAEGEDGVDRGIVQAVEVVTTTPASIRGIWSFLFGIDLVETIEAIGRAPDDPLLAMVQDVRRFGPKVTDGMWLRLLDVPAALSERRYAVDSRVVFELRDDFCGWNTGRFELEGGPDGATCRPTDAEPELSFTSNELGATFLGGTRLRTLARAGRVREHAGGAVARADAMFAGEREPWCPHQF